MSENHVDGPLELSKMVLDDWTEIPDLPSNRIIERIIAECYRLSFEPEEGRYPRLILAALGVVPPPSPYIRLGERPRFLQEIIAVTPAIAPPPFALIVSTGVVPYCKSIVHISSIANEPGILWGIRGPGEIEVETYRANEGIWQRKAWRLSRGICRPVHDISESRLFREVCDLAGEQSNKNRILTTMMLRDLVYSVSRRRHGGTLIFVKNEPQGATVPEIDFGVRPFPLLTIKEDQALHTQIFSCMTQIDGAVLIDSKFRVLGAGVFLDQRPIEVIEATPEGEGSAVDIRRLGSRHRSAAWFCGQNPGAYAIVISKDQVIRIFRRSETDDRVIVDGPFMDSMIEVARSGNTIL